MTLMKVVRREGISEPGHVTMTEFMGSNTNRPARNQQPVIPAAA
jgi:hypothetical protein